MELKQLEYFLAISKLGSFTRAADQLYISQPGITSAIRRLEEELGVELFVRKRKVAILTPEGRVFANHIQNVMSDVDTAINKVQELKNLNTGSIKVGISPSTGVSSAMFLLAKFKILYPDLSVELIEGSSEDLKEKLNDGKIDLAFLLLGQPDESSQLKTLAVTTQDIACGVPNMHLLKNKSAISVDMIRNEQLVLFKPQCPSRDIIDAYFAEHGLTPKISFETNYTQAILRLVLCGSGITLLPVEAMENNSSIVAVPLDPPIRVTTYLAYNSSHVQSKAAQTLFDFIKSSCGI